jgi:hypothetical protein
VQVSADQPPVPYTVCVTRCSYLVGRPGARETLFCSDSTVVPPPLSVQHTAAFLDLTLSRLCTSMNLAQYRMCV